AVLLMLGGFVFHWKKSIHDTMSILSEAAQAALETGDIEYLAYVLMVDGSYKLYIGQNLSETCMKVRAYAQTMHRHRQEKAEMLLIYTAHWIGQLTGTQEQESPPGADAEVELLRQFERNADDNSIAVMNTTQGMIRFFIQDYRGSL